MFKKIIIANRGEIALRIHKAAQELGIKTVALYSNADVNLLHVKQTDEAICIGDAPVKSSYLNKQAVITAAEITKADAIHPGYGFFAENADFAKLVTEQGYTFIGPKAELIALMRNKIAARHLMTKYNVQCVPGSLEPLTNDLAANAELADKIGFPVVIKAAKGGGGKAINVAYKPETLARTIDITRQQAAEMFGDDSVYLEKYLEDPRHIEVQVLADNFGNAIHLYARDCSTQRWNKKIIEEAPAYGVPELDLEAISNLCANVCKEVEYSGACTFEFLYLDGQFYFNEINTRVQVGHTVTEFITDMDIVKEQICVAAGEKLSKNQDQIRKHGHSIQCRIYAQDPRTQEASYGTITQFHAPGGPGIRVDAHIYDGYILPQNYDPLIAKIVAHGDTREHAIKRMSGALEELTIKGVKTNKTLHQAILQDPDFIAGKFTSSHLEKKLGPK